MPEGSKVLLISIDNLRYDCVSYAQEKPHLKQFYVENLVDTPTIDEIAKNCSVFTNCFSTSSYTTAAQEKKVSDLFYSFTHDCVCMRLGFLKPNLPFEIAYPPLTSAI